MLVIARRYIQEPVLLLCWHHKYFLNTYCEYQGVGRILIIHDDTEIIIHEIHCIIPAQANFIENCSTGKCDIFSIVPSVPPKLDAMRQITTLHVP